jgi:hypothetical protein
LAAKVGADGKGFHTCLSGGLPVLVLGVTTDDKGAQLESLIRTVLKQQGYKKVRSNVVGSGGNELDVVAVRESAVVGDVQITPLMCEAKAYADSVNMPVWQRFLGKLFIERAKDSTTLGMLVALNGINGNVAGSFAAVHAQDPALFVFEGADLVNLAVRSGEIGEEQVVRDVVGAQFHKLPLRMDTAYYGGGFYWVIWWKDDEYSVVDGHGRMMLTEDVEKLRGALEGTVSGSLLATEEARAEAEARHLARMKVMNRLFRGDEVPIAMDFKDSEAVAALAEEPFTRVEETRLVLAPPSELDAQAVTRLFMSMFEDSVRVALLSFMIGHHHDPYVERLVELVPDIQAGFSLDGEETATLRQVAVLFPSVWVTIASEMPMITTHRASQAQVVDESILASDRTSFWEAVINAIRSDFSNPRLRGFLYDYLGVAEIEERGEFVVKSKSGPVGLPIKTEVRNAVRQFADESVGQAGPVYVMIRLLPRAAEPWDDRHPEPEYPLDEDD